jgi:hypothetical protein
MEKVFARIAIIMIIFLCISLIAERLRSTEITVSGWNRDGSAAVDVEGKHQYAFTTSNKLLISPAKKSLLLLAPSATLLPDPLYCIYIIFVCVLLFIGINQYDYQLPFTKRFYKLFLLFTIITAVFSVVNLYRLKWFSDSLQEISNGKLDIPIGNIFQLPEFWILTIFSALMPLLKRGVYLQSKYLAGLTDTL